VGNYRINIIKEIKYITCAYKEEIRNWGGGGEEVNDTSLILNDEVGKTYEIIIMQFSILPIVYIRTYFNYFNLPNTV
jgi:hypothetical protein